jgi:predicted nuclease of predicted toxin-antitoxin system
LRKRSAASSRFREPRRPTTYFVDRSLGDRIVAEALRAHGLTVHVHRDHFPPDAKDEDWLREVGRRRWVVLTKDKMLRYRETEIAALLAAKVRAFVLTSGNLRADEMAEAFRKALPRMESLLSKVKGPFVARVTRGGKTDLLLAPKKE